MKKAKWQKILVYRKTLFLVAVFAGFIAFAYSNCAPSSLGTGSLDSNAALTLYPTTITVAPSGVQSFNATGGSGTYVSYSVTFGGGTITPNGVYTAPATAGSATVAVTDSNNKMAYATVIISSSSTGTGGITYYSCPVTPSQNCASMGSCESTCMGQLSSSPTCTYYTSGGTPNTVNCTIQSAIGNNFSCPVYYSNNCASASTCESTCMGQYQTSGTCIAYSSGTASFYGCTQVNGRGPVPVYSCPVVPSSGCNSASTCESSCAGQYTFSASCTYYNSSGTANTASCTLIGNFSY